GPGWPALTALVGTATAVAGACLPRGSRDRGCRRFPGATVQALCLPALLVLSALVAAPVAAAGLRIEPGHGMAAGEAAALRALVDDVLPRLPPRWRGQDLELRLDRREGVHGRIRGGRAWLARDLLDAGGETPSREAVAALLHELAHAWDREHGLSRDPRLLDLAGWQQRPLWPGRSRGNAFGERSPDAYE